MLNLNHTITTVKRKADGRTYSVGDQITHKGVIKEFRVYPTGEIKALLIKPGQHLKDGEEISIEKL